MDFSKLADLIAAFAAANDAFKAEHTKDYDSAECRASYDRKDEADNALEGAIGDALEEFTRELAAALREEFPRELAAALREARGIKS